jgi:hypothetical protein
MTDVRGAGATARGRAAATHPARLAGVTQPFDPPVSRGGDPSSIVALVRAGTLDAELAGLLWTLVDGGLSFLVAGPVGTARVAIRDALLELVPAGVTLRPVTSGDAEPAIASGDGDPAGSGALLVAPDLVPERAGDRLALDPGSARLVVRATTRGWTLAATIPGASLAEVIEVLEAEPVGLERDELSYLGVVLVTHPDGAGQGSADRVTAVHWIRPLVRDAHGHLQRLGPAVLATWDPSKGRWEHFAWGVLPELAMRLGRSVSETSLAADARADRVSALVGRDRATSPDA